jgi:hypothetical protein
MVRNNSIAQSGCDVKLQEMARELERDGYGRGGDEWRTMSEWKAEGYEVLDDGNMSNYEVKHGRTTYWHADAVRCFCELREVRISKHDVPQDGRMGTYKIARRLCRLYNADASGEACKYTHYNDDNTLHIVRAYYDRVGGYSVNSHDDLMALPLEAIEQALQVRGAATWYAQGLKVASEASSITIRQAVVIPGEKGDVMGSDTRFLSKYISVFHIDDMEELEMSKQKKNIKEKLHGATSDDEKRELKEQAKKLKELDDMLKCW